MATDAPLAAAPAKPKRREGRFGPRILLLLLAILGVGLAWLGASLRQMKQIADREQIEKALLDAGGWSCDKFRFEGKDWVWATVKTDAGLEALKALPQLQILDLTDSRVTDAGLVHLENLPRLERLYIDGTDVTDAVLDHIKKLPWLRVVCLYATQVTEPAVIDLRNALPNLRVRW